MSPRTVRHTADFVDEDAAGYWFTVSVKLCVASGITPFVAVIVIA